MERGDSDGEDAMAYFLPNGIADDSPPKRSVFGQSSFGSIGARFGSSSLAGNVSSTQFGSSSLYGGLSRASSPRENAFSLSELGGEVHRPESSDRGEAIGAGRRPFSFSSAFSSLAATADSVGRSTGLFDSKKPTNAFRNDQDLFGGKASDPVNRTSQSLFGSGPTLNANAPAFMVSGSSASQEVPSHYGSSSPTRWPSSTNTKPRRVLHAPPGLTKSTDELPMTPRATTNDDDGSMGRAPPGLLRPTHSSPFRGYTTPTSASASASTSMFSNGSSPFDTPLQPQYTSFLGGHGSLDPEPEFKSALSELNARSMSVDEIQSSLEATAIAAAHDVVDEKREKRDGTSGFTTPRRSKRGDPTRGKSPHVHREERNRNVKSSPDVRLQTPTRRNETPASASSPASRTSDRRGRNSKNSQSTDAVTRPDEGNKGDTTSKLSRKPRGGIYAAIEARTSRNSSAAIEVTTNALYRVTVRKKPPSSVSSVGSDDQLLSIATLLVDEVEENVVSSSSSKSMDTQGDSKGSTRAMKSKKSTTSSSESKASTKRQSSREKQTPIHDPQPVHDPVVIEDAPRAGSEGDPSYADSPVVIACESRTTSTATSTPILARPDKSQKKPSLVVSAPSTNKNEPKVGDTQVSTSTTKARRKSHTSVENGQPLPAVESSDSSDPKTDDGPTVNKEEVLSSQSLAQDAALPSDDTVHVSEEPPVFEDTVDKAKPEAPVMGSSVDEPSTPPESDSGSEIPEVRLNKNRTAPTTERKAAKEQKKEKLKKEKSSERKKSAMGAGRASKKDKRESSSSGKGDFVDEEPLFSAGPLKKPSPSVTAMMATKLRSGRVLAKRALVAFWSGIWFICSTFADRINLKGVIGSGLSYLESILAVIFSVILLLSLHGASWFIRIHRVAFRAILTHRHVGFCFAFPYAFPFLVQYVFPWAPPWAPVCLWYAFLVQLFCTSGPTAMVATFRVILPLVFLIEGISHHSFLLDLNGAELLLASFILSALKTGSLCSPIFLLSFAVQSISAIFLGSEMVVQWFQTALALYSLHAMAATDEDWAGLGDEEDGVSCRQMSVHHSIADYNYYPAPSAPSVQKTKRLDRRALAYVRGRKLR